MFPGLGTIVNTLAVALIGTFGSLIHGAISDRFHKTVLAALGLGVTFLGVLQCIQGLMALMNYDGLISTYALLIFVGALIAGALLGEALRLEQRLEGLGHRINKALKSRHVGILKIATAHESDYDFVEGFVTASLFFCVGAMMVLGSIQDGLGQPGTLFVKAVLDGVTSLFLASSLGIGVAFSAIPILVLQGLLALVAHWVGPLIPHIALMGLEATGGVLIAAVGLNLLFHKKLPVGNMLPAIFLSLAAVWIMA